VKVPPISTPTRYLVTASGSEAEGEGL
jgi:hypothetical protein